MRRRPSSPGVAPRAVGLLACLAIGLVCWLLVWSESSEDRRFQSSGPKKERYQDFKEQAILRNIQTKGLVPPMSLQYLKPDLHVRFVIPIKTAVSLYALRRALRDSWLQLLPNSTLYFFYVGGNYTADHNYFDLELQCHQDVLVLKDVSDGYYSTNAKMYAMFRWLAENLRFTYAISLDDDSFLNPYIFEHVASTWRPTLMYRGLCWVDIDISRTGKWGDTNFWECEDYYPPYCMGGTFVLSEDLVRWMAESEEVKLRLSVNDDVMVGAWVRTLEGVSAEAESTDLEFVHFGSRNPRDVFLMHNTGPAHMIKTWIKVRAYIEELLGDPGVLPRSK